jgi:hypothetical protein
MRTGRLLVEALSEESALRLVEQLRGVHAELAPGEGTQCVVAIELDPTNDRWLTGVLSGLESWLIRGAIGMACLSLDGRHYVLERPAESAGQ